MPLAELPSGDLVDESSSAYQAGRIFAFALIGGVLAWLVVVALACVWSTMLRRKKTCARRSATGESQGAAPSYHL